MLEEPHRMPRGGRLSGGMMRGEFETPVVAVRENLARYESTRKIIERIVHFVKRL
jgi:hypothetical protein